MVRLPDDSTPDSKVIFPEQWHGRPAAPGPELPAVPNRDEGKRHRSSSDHRSPAPGPAAEPQPRPALPSSPSAAISSRATPRPPTRSRPSWPTPWRPATDRPRVAGALVPWICDALLSNHSVKAYGRDFMDFVRHMQAQGVTPLEVTADHVKLYKRALLEAGMTLGHRRPAAVGAARRLRAARGQGAGLLGDRPGHRRRQGPRRPEERHAVADAEAGDRPAGGHPHRYACRASATWR